MKNWIDPIRPFLENNDVNIVILHMHSLRFGDQPVSGSSTKYKSYDIGKLKIKKIISLLVKLQPDIVIFFHFKSFADYIVLRFTKLLNIKSIYLQHGVYCSNVFNFVNTSHLSSISRYFFHLIQYFQFIFIKPKNIINEFCLVIKFFLKNDLKGTKYDYTILYSKYSLDYIQDKFCFEKNQIRYSGFPLYKFQDQLAKDHSSILNQPKKEKRVLFLQGKIIPAHTSISYDQEYEYFKTIINICVKYNYNITMRLHPRVDHEFYNKMLADDEVKIEHHISLYDQILVADIIIGNMSTALFGAVIYKKPIITIFYPGFKILTDIFDEIAIKAANYNCLDIILKSPDEWDKKLSLYEGFIDKYIGRNNSYEHQAKVISKIIDIDRGTIIS